MQKNNNIIFSCGSDSWGGLEIITLDLALKLQKEGYNISLLCKKDSKLHFETEKNNIRSLPFFQKDAGIIKTIHLLKKYLKDNKTDIIHSHLSHDLWVLTPALKLARYKGKLYLTKHMASGVKKNDIFHKYLYRRVNRIFAISEYIKTSLIDTVPVNKEKISLLHIGIDTDRFNNNRFKGQNLKKEFNFPEDKLVIGIVGRMTPGKGHEDLLNAAEILRKKYPGKLYFALIGGASYGENEYGDKIKNLAARFSTDEIGLYDFSDVPEKIMAALDILVFPSHDESFGRILAEAMALGVPTAASRYAGVLDIAIENQTGLLFERKNPVSMAQALEKLINDKELRKKFSTEGRKRIAEHFNLNDTIKKQIDHYTGNE